MKNARPDKMTELTITQEQIEYAQKIAKQINEDKQNFNDRGQHAQQAMGLDLDNIGFLGETIYADHKNWSRPELYEGKNDPGYDFQNPETGETIDVKTSVKGKDLILFPTQLKDLPDRLVRIYIDLQEETAEITMDISKETFKENYEIRDLGYGKRAYLSHDNNNL